jgi:hypothetical protein
MDADMHVLLPALAIVAMVLTCTVTRAAPAPRDAPAETARTAEPVRFAVAIKNRKVDAAQKQIRVRQGDVLELAFTSDERAELHLHGYDRLLTVEPGAPAILRLEARIAGRFSIEAHGFGDGSGGRRGSGHVVLLYLEVYPR